MIILATFGVLILLSVIWWHVGLGPTKKYRVKNPAARWIATVFFLPLGLYMLVAAFLPTAPSRGTLGNWTDAETQPVINACMGVNGNDADARTFCTCATDKWEAAYSPEQAESLSSADIEKTSQKFAAECSPPAS